jgi:hypothetical protein
MELKKTANMNIRGNHFYCIEEAILTHLLTLFAVANEVSLFYQCNRCSMASHQNTLCFLLHVTSNHPPPQKKNNKQTNFSHHSNNFECFIQDASGEKVSILRGHSISHSKQKVYAMYICPVTNGF